MQILGHTPKPLKSLFSLEATAIMGASLTYIEYQSYGIFEPYFLLRCFIHLANGVSE
jgi:hypothetical protein